MSEQWLNTKVSILTYCRIILYVYTHLEKINTVKKKKIMVISNDPLNCSAWPTVLAQIELILCVNIKKEYKY